MRHSLHTIAVTSLLALGSLSAHARINDVAFGGYVDAHRSADTSIVTKWPILLGSSDNLSKWPILNSTGGNVGKWPILHASAEADSFASLNAGPSFASSIAPATSAFQFALGDFAFETGHWLHWLGGFGRAANDDVFNGIDKLGQAETAIAAPIPEPSTYALMVAGLFGVGFIARRRGLTR